jgi:hypothetical protein
MEAAALVGQGSLGFASVSIRTQFSATHAISASLIVREVAEVEATASVESVDRVRAYATAGICTAVAFMEATINEFFCDVVEEPAGQVIADWRRILPEREWRTAVALWEGAARVSRLQPAIEKYNVALAIFGKAEFDRGTAPFQDAKLAADVRNALMHAEPVTHSDDKDASTKRAVDLSSRLRGRFAPAKFFESSATFPDGLLGKGGAQWAFASCLALTDGFFDRLGITPRYAQHVRR